MSPSHLHSDPVQVFDVEQHQTQDPVEVPQGKGFPRDLLTSTCRPQPPSPAPVFLGIFAVFSASLSLGSLSVSYTLSALPSPCLLLTLRFPHHPKPLAPHFMFSTLRPRTAHTGMASTARKRIQPL